MKTGALKQFLSVACLYALGGLAGLTLFVLLEFAGAFNFIRIFFYRGIVALLVAAVIHGIAMYLCLFLLKRAYAVFKSVSYAHAFSIIVCAFSLNFAFFTLVPVALDRSVTIFLLGYMSKDPDRVYSRQDLSNALEDIYIKKYGAIDRRIDEQVVSRNLVLVDGGKFKLTKQAVSFVNFSKSMARVFNVDPKFLDPQLPPDNSSKPSAPLRVMP